MADLVNYKPSDYPQIPNAEAQYFTKEFRNISIAINSAEKAIVSDESDITTLKGDITTINGDITAIGPQFRSYLAGLQLSNDATTPNTVLDISAGACRDSANAANIVLPAFTKSTAGTWAAGSGSNGLGTGLTLANAFYHVFAIVNNGQPDIYFDTSVTGAHAPVGTSAFRRLGTIGVNGSLHITPFSQNGDEFLWKTANADASGVSQSTTAAAVTLSVPPGVRVYAKFDFISQFTSSQGAWLVYALDMGTQAVNVPVIFYNAITPPAGGAFEVPIDFTVRTNASAQIGVVGVANGGAIYNISTYGWIDRRGKDD